MAFSIFRVVDLAGGKITSELINNIQGQEFQQGEFYKFTFVKASELKIEPIVDSPEEQKSFKISFKYKDNY